MKEYLIPVSWTVQGVIKIQAESLSGAIEMSATKQLETVKSEYIEGSYQVDFDLIEELNNLSDTEEGSTYL